MTKFRVGTNSRRLNRETNQWEDADECFLTVTVWRDMAENVAETLHRGDPVLIIGDLKDSSYERDGQQIRSYEVVASSVGPGLRFVTAKLARTTRQGAQQQPAQGDPWATPPPAQQRPQQAPQQPEWQPSYEEPPFAAPGYEFTAGS